MAADAGPALLPCPFCGGGETVVHRNRGTSRGMSDGVIRYGEDVSVEVRHWCPPVEGQLTRGGITFVGRDLASAVAAWNRPRPAVSDAPPASDVADVSEAVPALRWQERRDAYDRVIWWGHSGAEMIAYVWSHVAPGVCRWSLALNSDGPVGDGGDAPTLDAAKAAAEAAFVAWCERAGLCARGAP